MEVTRTEKLASKFSFIMRSLFGNVEEVSKMLESASN